MTTGDKIRFFRKRAGLTQTQLANAAGVHPVSIRKYETNKMQPQPSQLKKIATALNISPNALIELESSILRLETLGDFMSILYMLLGTGKIHIEGNRQADHALEASTVLLKIKDHAIVESLCRWEKAQYLYQSSEECCKQKEIKMDSIIYMEIMGIAEDENGDPVPTGMEINMGDISQGRKIPYDVLAEAINVPALLSNFGLDLKPNDIKIITPEIYAEKYGERSKKRHAED